MAVRPIDIRYLESKASNIYEAIVVMSKRARQINEELKIEFNKRLELVQSKQMMESTDENVEPEVNPDQINIAREFEKLPKPTGNALEELMGDKLGYWYKEENQKQQDAE